MLDLKEPKPTQIEYYMRHRPQDARMPLDPPMDIGNLMALHTALWLMVVGLIILWNLPSYFVFGLLLTTGFHVRKELRKHRAKK